MLVRVFLSILAENKRIWVNFIKDFLMDVTSSMNVLSKSLSASSSTSVLTSCTLSFLLLMSCIILLGVPTTIAGFALIESICLEMLTSPINAADENVLFMQLKMSFNVLLTWMASSLVGTSIIACILLVSALSLLIIGIRYARVLPVPVPEHAQTSLPDIICLYV